MAGAELSIVVDLGSSTFRLRHSGLSLTSYVFVKLIVPENCALLLHSGRLEEMLKSVECCVTPAPELVLHAHVQGNGDSHTSSYLELVSEILQDEKVWVSLGLTVTMKSCTPGFYSTTDSSILFDIQENHLNTPIRHLPHKLLDLFSTVFPPPAAIPRVSLSEVHISLNFHRSNGKYNKATMGPSVVEMDPIELCVIQSRPGFACDEKLRNCAIREYNSSLPCIRSDIRSVPFQLEFESLGRHLESSGTQPQRYFAGYSAEKRGFNCSEDSIGVCRLLRTCFDDIFVPRRSRHAGGIERIKEGTIYNLSDIIPNVFSPGYSEAMQQRACLIPVIAKAMSSIVESSGTLTSSQKLSSLQGYYASLQGSDANIYWSSNTRLILKDLLWRVAQKGLYRVKATRKMWGFASVNKMSSPDFESIFTDDDSILEDDINSDDDLLDNEECEDNDSMCLIEEDLCSLTLEDSMGYEDSVNILEMDGDYGSEEGEHKHHDDNSVLSNREEADDAYGNCSQPTSDILDHNDQMLSSQLAISRSSSLSPFDRFWFPLSDQKQDLDMFHADEFESAFTIEEDMMALDERHMRNITHAGDIDEEILHY